MINVLACLCCLVGGAMLGFCLCAWSASEIHRSDERDKALALRALEDALCALDPTASPETRLRAHRNVDKALDALLFTPWE